MLNGISHAKVTDTITIAIGTIVAM